MADTKITALTALTAADPANDVIPIVDVSDTSMAASGTTKKISVNNILGASGTATLASATITGDLTVDTSTLVVDATNNRVGVLTASPRSGFALDVLGNVAIGSSASTGSFPLIIDSLGTAGNVASIRFKAANVAKAYFGLSGSFAGDATTDAIIATDAAGAAIRFYVADTGLEAMRLNSTANLVLKGGTVGASGVGVTFPATQVASSDANCLDDYEEGTWTGTLAGSTTNPTVAVTATGRYTKIGRQVYVQIIFGSANTTGASGDVSITGLPFANNASIASQGSILSDNTLTFTGSPFVFVDLSASTLLIYQSTSNAAASACTHNAGTPRYLYANLTYTVA